MVFCTDLVVGSVVHLASDELYCAGSEALADLLSPKTSRWFDANTQSHLMHTD